MYCCYKVKFPRLIPVCCKKGGGGVECSQSVLNTKMLKTTDLGCDIILLFLLRDLIWQALTTLSLMLSESGVVYEIVTAGSGMSSRISG